MRIHHLNCGTFCPISAALMNGRGSLFERGRLVCHCLLIEADRGLILIDTGLGLEQIADPLRHLPGRLWQWAVQAQLKPEESALQQVRALGFDPQDVRDIVLTHLDFDHAGGLPEFSHARMHVFEPEFAAAMQLRGPIANRRYPRTLLRRHYRWELHELRGERWAGFEAVSLFENDEAMPLIALVPLVGHSPGHCGVAVHAGERWLLHLGDAMFFHGELDRDRRRCPPGLHAYQNIFQHNRRMRMRNQRRLRRLAANPPAEIEFICAHDPTMFDPHAERIRPAAVAYVQPRAEAVGAGAGER